MGDRDCKLSSAPGFRRDHPAERLSEALQLEDYPISLGELATKLARPRGRETPDPAEYWNILRALWMLVEGERFFAQDDVLMRNAAGEFELFLPALRTACEEEAREGRNVAVDDFEVSRPLRLAPAPDVSGLALSYVKPGLIEVLEKASKVLWPRVRINAAVIFLRRPAARRYLESCELEGAQRALRELGLEELAVAAAEPAMHDGAGDTLDGPAPHLKTPVVTKDDLQARYDQRVTKDHAPTLEEDEAWRKEVGFTRTRLKELRRANPDRRLHQVGPRTKGKT